MSMRNISVLGGSGCVGGHLVPQNLTNDTPRNTYLRFRRLAGK